MTLSLNVNGTIFAYPETRETDWGSEASAWAAAITTGVLQKSGGSFVLLAEVDFGASFGLKSLYYRSRSSDVASSGQIRLARTDVLSFRNQANNANLDLGVNSSDQLTFNGTSVVVPSFSDTTTIDLTLASSVVTADVIAGSLTNTHINASAAIARSKLATGTASRAVINDGSGALSESSVTSTTLAFLDATSSVQTQLNAKLDSVSEDTSPALGGNLNGSTFNITNVGTLQGTTVTGTTGQIGGTISAQNGNFSNSLTISGIPVMLQTVLSRDTSPSLGGNLNGATFNISSVGTMQATTVTGTTGQFGGTASAQSLFGNTVTGTVGQFSTSLSAQSTSAQTAVFSSVNSTTLQGTTVTGTTGQFGGNISGRNGSFDNSLTISGVAVNIKDTWGEISTNSLNATSSTLSVSSVPASEYLQVIVEYSLDNAVGTEVVNLTFNGDTGSNYTYERIRAGGSSSGSGANIELVDVGQGATATHLHSFIIINRPSRVKIGTGTSTFNVVGGTSSSSETLAFSWNNTSSAISSITLTSETAAVFQVGSRIKVLGMGF